LSYASRKKGLLSFALRLVNIFSLASHKNYPFLPGRPLPCYLDALSSSKSIFPTVALGQDFCK